MFARPAAAPLDAAMPARGAADLTISTERLRCLMLWLTGASGAIVFIEPSPYEVMSFLTMAIFTMMRSV